MNLIQLLTNENPIMINILAFIFSIIQAILFYEFISTIMKLNTTKKEKYLYIIITALLGGVINLLPNTFINDILNITVFILLVKFNFHQGIKSSFMALIFTYIVTLFGRFCIILNSAYTVKR